MTDTPTPVLIPLDLVDDNPFQPRLVYDALRIMAIAASIAEHGLLQVPIARQVDGGRYQLAFGHSRARAYRHLATNQPGEGWRVMPLIVRALDDETMALHAWAENRDRSDLTAYEEAKAIETYTTAFGWSHKAAAERLQLDRTTVTNKLSLLRLPQQVLTLLERGELSERQAMALRPLAELPTAAWDAQFQIWTGQQSIASLEHLVTLAPSWPADRLRERVTEVLNKLTIDLDKEEFAKREIALATVRAASCKECPLRLKSTNRCSDATCAGDKRAVILREKAAPAAEKAKLPAVVVQSYRDYDGLSGVPLPALRAEAKRRGCGKLGVAYADQWFSHQVADHPKCGIVCAHGEGGRCVCKAAVSRGAENAAAVNEAAQKKADKKQMKQVYKEPAEAALASVLAATPIGALRLLVKRLGSHNTLEKLGAGATGAQLAQELATILVKEEIKYHYDYGVDLPKAKQALEKMLTAAEVAFPWAAQEAAAQEAEQATRIALLRQRLDEARELAELPIADSFLGDARQLLGRLPEGHPEHAALAGEIAGAQAAVDMTRIAAQQRSKAQAAEDAQREAEHEAAYNAQFMTAPAPSPRRLSLEEIAAHLAAIEERWNAHGGMGATDEENLRWLGEELAANTQPLIGRKGELRGQIQRMERRLSAQGAKAAPEGVRAHLPALDSGDALTFAQIVAWLDAIDSGAQPLDEDQLGHLADHLQELAGDATIPDGDFEAATVRIEDLADQVIARAKAAD
jgi:ParB/RepB/Spo0J family partition protein